MSAPQAHGSNPAQRASLPRSACTRTLLPAILATLALLLLPAGAHAAFGYLGQFGGYGSTDGRFDTPTSVTAAGDGTVFVADTHNNRIQRFTAAHVYAGQWGVYGDAAGEFDWPRGVAAGGGAVLVNDAWNDRVQAFMAASGTHIATWSASSWPVDTFSAADIASDTARNRVAIPNADSLNPAVEIVLNSTGEHQATITGNGLNRPVGVAFDGGGNVVVANTGANNIKVFTSAGTHLRTFGAAGQGAGQLNAPEGVAVDATGDIWVADTGNHRIQRFSSTGVFEGAWGTSGSGAGQFWDPTDVAVEPDGHVLVADSGNDRIQVFGEGAEPPVSTAPPTIGGDAVAGDWIWCINGSWAGDVPQTYTYSWLRNGTPVADGEDLELSAADVGAAYVCRVTATNSAGTATAESAAVTVAAAHVDPPPIVAPPPVAPPPVAPPPVAPPTGGVQGGTVTAPTDKAGAPAVTLRLYRQNLKKVIKSGVYVAISMDKSGTAKATLRLDKATMRRLKLKLKDGVVATQSVATPVGGGLKYLRLKFRSKALTAIKRQLKLKRSVKITVQVTGKDKAGKAAKTVKKTYTLRSGASA